MESDASDPFGGTIDRTSHSLGAVERTTGTGWDGVDSETGDVYRQRDTSTLKHSATETSWSTDQSESFGGTGTSSKQSTTVSHDLWGGELGLGVKNSDTATFGEETVANLSSEASFGVKADDGLTATRTLSDKTTWGEGADAMSYGTAQTTQGGLVWTGDEAGVGWGSSREVYQGRDTWSSGTSSQVTDKGVTGSRTAGVSRKGRHGTIGAKTSLDGGVTVEVEAVEGRKDQVRLVVTLALGGTGTGSLDKNQASGDKTSAGGTLSAGLSAEARYVHLLGVDEAERYLTALDGEHDGAPSQVPELNVISRLVAVGANGEGGLDALASTVSAAAAADMPVGDSMTLTLSGSVSAGLSAKQKGGEVTSPSAGGSAGLNASGEASRVVTVKPVSTDAGRRVEVRVAFDGKGSVSGEVSGSYLGGTLGANGSVSGGAGDATVFRLDPAAPDYDDVYGRIIGCATPSALDAIREDEAVASHLHAQEASLERGSSLGGTAGVGGVGLSVGSASSREETVTREDGRVGFKGDASRKEEVGVSVGGVGALRTERKEGAQYSVKGGGASMAVTRREENGSWSLAGAWDYATSFLDPAAYSLEGTPAERLEKAVTRTRTQLSEVRLDPGDVRALFARAADGFNWELCAIFAGTRTPWMDLRGRLLAPVLDPELVAVNEADARLVAQGQAVLDFVETTDCAVDVIERALRHWGEVQDSEVGFGATDLGVKLDWSGPQRASREQWLRVEGLIRVLPATVDRAIEDGAGGIASAQEEVERLRGDLSALADGLDGGAYESGRAELEMRHQVEVWQLDVREREEQLALARLHAGEGTSLASDVEGASTSRIAHAASRLRDAAGAVQDRLDGLAHLTDRPAWQTPDHREQDVLVDLFDLADYWFTTRTELLSLLDVDGGQVVDADGGFDLGLFQEILDYTFFGNVLRNRHRQWTSRLAQLDCAVPVHPPAESSPATSLR